MKAHLPPHFVSSLHPLELETFQSPRLKSMAGFLFRPVDKTICTPIVEPFGNVDLSLDADVDMLFWTMSCCVEVKWACYFQRKYRRSVLLWIHERLIWIWKKSIQENYHSWISKEQKWCKKMFVYVFGHSKRRVREERRGIRQVEARR